jgi:hypothetical protein
VAPRRSSLGMSRAGVPGTPISSISGVTLARALTTSVYETEVVEDAAPAAARSRFS